MLCKSVVFFGLLAIFAIQGMEASHFEARPSHLDARHVELRALSDLIDQVKELIANLQSIVSGALGNALGTITGLVDTVKAIKEKFLDQGLSGIKDIVGNALEFIANKTEEAAKLGIDISTCIAGKYDQLEDLATSLAGEVTSCITNIIVPVFEMINNDLTIINEITNTVTALPSKLAKCMINLKPITCVTNLITNLTEFLAALPAQISNIVKEALDLVEKLPGELEKCVDGITITGNAQVNAVIEEIQNCVDELMPPARY